MFNRDWRADKVAQGLKPGIPNAFDVNVGDDGTVDFSFNRRCATDGSPHRCLDNVRLTS